MAKRLTEERIEKMAVEIRAFLLEHGIWQDTDIYFNGKRHNQRPGDEEILLQRPGEAVR